jgi:glutamate/tyrosine decarboxylase-like PLP-dependent enzyme
MTEIDKNSLRDLIQSQELEARKLDTTPAEMETWLSSLQAFSKKFLNELPNDLAVNPNPNVPKLIEQIPPSHPADFSGVFSQLENEVLRSGLNASSGRYVAYVPGGGIPSAAIGDYLAALTNRYSGNYGACPAAAEIENTCIRWLINMVGLPPNSWGVLTSGGTLAALMGFVAARNTRRLSEWAKGVIYMTSECHHSIPKVLNTIGLGHLTTRTVPVDSEFRMDPQALKQLVVSDKEQGLSPWIICSTAGTTNTGAVDPIAEISAIAKTYGLWLHVDGAYGGFFVLAEKGKDLLKDMALADSLVLDPHKSFFLPYGCGAILVRDAKGLHSAFSHSPDYLHDLQQEKELSPSDFSLEGTRHFRGLRMWLSMKLHGLERFRATLQEKLLLAQYADQRLKDISGIETGPTPQLSCVTFRVKGESDAESDQLTQKVLDEIQKRGIFYNSSTRLKGNLYLRLCILNFRTHMREIEIALKEIEELSRKVRG